jgi:hypothetical protein
LTASARRVHLYDLTAGAGVCGTGSDHQCWIFPYNGGAYTDVGVGEQGPQANNDMFVFPGGNAAFTEGDFIGNLHMAGVDTTFWDETGWWTAIPAAFSGIDQFTTWINDIYGMAKGSYATGSSGTTLVSSVTNSYSIVGQCKWGGSVPGVTVAGVPATLGLVSLGDAAVTAVDNVKIGVGASRPQSVPAPVTSYSFYASKVAADAPGSGNLLATQTVTPTTAAHLYDFTPPDGEEWFITITATDGTRTYVYPQLVAARQRFPAIHIPMLGNSYLNSGYPLRSLTRAFAAFGMDVAAWNVGFNGATIAQYDPSYTPDTAHGTPFDGTAVNPLQWAINLLAREAGKLGHPLALVIVFLVENNTGDSPSSVLAGIKGVLDALLATGNVTRTSPRLYVPRVYGGDQGLGQAINAAVATLDTPDGNYLILDQAQRAVGANYQWDGGSNHPSYLTAQLAMDGLAADYQVRIVNPPASAPTATSYNVPDMPPSPVVGETYTVTAVLNNPASATGVITPTPASGITWGAAISIGSGGVSGTTTVVFNTPGTYTPAFTHTGLGFSGNPTLGSSTATNPAGAGPTAEDVAAAVWASSTRTLTAFGFAVTASSVTDKAGYSLNLAQLLSAPRVLDAVADNALTVNDALHAAISENSGRESTAGTAYTKKTPAGTTLRTFTLDDATTPTSRT